VKKLLNNMWVFVAILLVVSMGLSTLFYFIYMRGRL
jgi:hypothetical protein